MCERDPYFRSSEDTVSHANVRNVFMIGVGELFAVTLAAFLGRRVGRKPPTVALIHVQATRYISLKLEIEDVLDHG